MGALSRLTSRCRGRFARSAPDGGPRREHEKRELRDVVAERSKREAEIRRGSGMPGISAVSGY